MLTEIPPDPPLRGWRNPERPDDLPAWFGAAKHLPPGHRPASLLEWQEWRARELARRAAGQPPPPLEPPSVVDAPASEAPASGAPPGMVDLRAPGAIDWLDVGLKRAAVKQGEPDPPAPVVPRPALPSKPPAEGVPVPWVNYAPSHVGDHGGPKGDDPPLSARALRRQKKQAMNQDPPRESYESILRAEVDEAEEVRVTIRRVMPNPGDVGELNVLQESDHCQTLGALRDYCTANFYDGQPSRFLIELWIDGDSMGKWPIVLPKDPLRLAARAADERAQIEALYRSRGLTPPPQPGAASFAPPYAAGVPLGGPAPAAAPPGYVTQEQVETLIAAAVQKTIAALGGVAPSSAPAPVAPAPAAGPAAPAAPAAPGYMLQADAEALVKKAAQEAAAAMAPPKPEEKPKTAIEALEKGVDELDRLSTAVDRAKEKLGVSAPVEAADPVVEKNGVALPAKMLETDPKMALAAMNMPIVKGILDSVKEGVLEVLESERKGKREEVKLMEQENREREKSIALREREARLMGGGQLSQGAGEVVGSDEWPTPRGKRAT